MNINTYHTMEYIGNKVHNITYYIDNEQCKSDCGLFADIENIGGTLDFTLAKLNRQLCKKCFKDD